MRKVIFFVFILSIVLTSCALSEHTAVPTVEPSYSVINNDPSLLPTKSLVSASTYTDRNLKFSFVEYDGTTVAFPELPTEELKVLLDVKLTDYLATLDLPFKPTFIDYTVYSAFDTLTFVFYPSDSVKGATQSNLVFSYNTLTNSVPVTEDYFTKQQIDVIFERFFGVPCFSGNFTVDSISVTDSELVLTSANNLYKITGEMMSNADGDFFAFHPNDYYPVTDSSEKFVALTFDDGPNPVTTKNLLAVLKEKGVKATFFMVGYNIAEYPYVVKSVYESGHDIGLHSYKHSNYGLMEFNEVVTDLDKCTNLIYSIVGKRPYLVRPPFGNIDEEKIDTNDYFFVNWNVDPLDWSRETPEEIANDALKHISSGSIVLMHDIYQKSVDAAEIIIDKLVEKNYRFVTISELFDLNGKKSDNKLHFFKEDYDVKE